MTDYPDISDILARKAEGRRDLAKLDFWEKVRRMEALRERVRFLKELREADRRAKVTPHFSDCGAGSSRQSKTEVHKQEPNGPGPDA